MRKYIIPLMFLSISVSAHAQKDTIGVSQFTAIYRYKCKTINADGQSVIDSMHIAVQTSDGITKSFPLEEYDRQKKGNFRIADSYQAALMHMATIFMNYPEGQITAQEMLYPYRYQTNEALEKQAWELTDTQDSICGYTCRSAKTKYHGITWKAYYAEDIPSGIGPWKFGGLPGLITKVTDIKGVHTFTLCGLLKEETPIVFTKYATWFVPDGHGNFVRQRVDCQKVKASALLAYKRKVLGNSRYLKNPTYYAPDPMEVFGYVEKSYTSTGDGISSAAGVVIISNPRQYQPLEVK